MVDAYVPFNRVKFKSGEFAVAKAALANGHISGDGPFSRRAEEILASMHNGSRALLTPSCSHALELAARLIQFDPGDEVIVPSFTFVTSVSSFVANGAKPVFCDINPITLGLDLNEARRLVSERTKAICLVHYGGVPADPEGFAQLAKEYDLILIEDNAHGFGGESNGRRLGTFGALSTLSFHETKNITCGEGGGLVINESEFVDRAEILREKGTDRSSFFRGQVDKYTWRDLGSSWILSDILAAVLYAQLCEFETIQSSRRERWDRYSGALAGWARNLGVGTPGSASGTAHIFYLILRDAAQQTAFLQHLKSRGVNAVFHYQSLHRSPYGSQFLQDEVPLPVTERVSDGLVRLPLFSSLTSSEQDQVIQAVLDFTG
jgi:dTDP-4-amino-4,6-dideoxygalactose transaminase